MRHVNENKKLHQDFYCSLVCAGKNHRNRVTLICENPNCNNTFERSKASVLKHNYCSRSCSASVNNTKFPKIIAKTKDCFICHKKFKGNNSMYCSLRCKLASQTISAEQIIKSIQQYVAQFERIPLKVEFKHAKAAQKVFGSWNKAIKEAGFKPNPVMFSRKYLAKDGHKCDSFAEKVIDDWLFNKNIFHERNIPYGFQNMTADFKINDVWIEYFGLHGQLKKYDRLIKQKEKFWKEKNLKTISIYPNDLYPYNNLENIFKLYNLI